MPRLAANLSMMFREVPFLERFERARAAGFPAVEFQFPYEHVTAAVRDALHAAGLPLVLFNMPPGDWASGDRGLAILPDRVHAFRNSVEIAIDHAIEFGCRKLHVMAGVGTASVDPALLRRTYVDNLRYAAQFCAGEGIDVLIEPLNATDFPGYFLTSVERAAEIIDEAGEPNLFLQYDLYHQSFAGPDLITPFLAHREMIGHVQIAGFPGRHEPDVGQMDAEGVLAALDAGGYGGFVGCEYVPAGRTEEGLGWARRWLRPAEEAR